MTTSEPNFRTQLAKLLEESRATGRALEIFEAILSEVEHRLIGTTVTCHGRPPDSASKSHSGKGIGSGTMPDLDARVVRSLLLSEPHITITIHCMACKELKTICPLCKGTKRVPMELNLKDFAALLKGVL